MSDPIKFERVSLEDARKTLDRHDAVGPKVDEQDWRWARSYKPPVLLSDAAKAWLAKLPADVRPNDLASQYPRVANRLVEVWSNADQCDRYFDSLGLDRKNGRRQGFPPGVAQEIEALRAYHAKPAADRTLWDSSTYRRR